MSVAYNPSIVTNGLVLAYDAANIKSFDAGENLFTYSEDITQTQWIKTNTSVTSNAIFAPNGTFTADKYAGINGATSRQSIYQNVTFIAGIKYTLSVFVKRAERRYFSFWFDSPNISESAYYGAGNIIDLQTGTLASGSTPMNIVSVGNGWYRCSLTATPTANGSFALSFAIGEPNNNPPYNATGDGTSGLFIWGAQLEKGTTATNYTKTLATNNPRSNSVLDLSGNVNTGIISSLSYSDIKAFNFNGTSNYIFDSILSFPAVNNNTTILCWAWPDSTGPVNPYTGLVAFGGRTGSTPSDAVLLCLNTNAATWYVGSAYWNNDYNPSNLPVTKDAWNMVGIVARSAGTTNNTKLICGNASGLSSVTGSSSDYVRGVVPTKANLTIGCTDNGGGRYMKGKIGIVLIYNRELSDTEIMRNFLAMKSRYGI